MRSDPFRSGAIATLLFAIACGGSSGGGSGQAPHPTEIVPNSGYSTSPTQVEINGSGFLVKATQPSGGGDATLDTGHKAWLGETPLTDVTWVSTGKLTATVPAGLPVGVHKLTVENALGERGSLDAAFTVLSAPSFSARVAASRTSVNVGQSFTLTLTVTNNGGADITNISLGEPSLSSDEGATATLSGPSPSAPATLAAGASQSFTWNCTAGNTQGTLTISVSASGKDSLTGEALTATPPAAAQVSVQQPAALSAVFDPLGSVAIDTSFEVRMVVTNTGGATASAVNPGTPSVTTTSGIATAALSAGPMPASASIEGGASQTFVWTYHAGGERGTLRFSGSVSGADANSGAPLAATATSGDAVVAAAAINATVLATPDQVTRGQDFDVVIRFENPGNADVSDFNVANPAPTGVCTRQTTPPTSLSAHEHVDVTWGCSTNATAGPLDITFTAVGLDRTITPAQAIQGSATARIAVQNPPSLTVPTGGWSASPTTNQAGQPITVTLRLANASGAATANVTSLTPSITPATNASCTGLSPVPSSGAPVAIAGGASQTFTWTCTASTYGNYTLDVSLGARDANTGESASVPNPTGLAVTFTQTFTVNVAVSGTGGSVSSTNPVSTIAGCSSTGGANCSAQFQNGTAVELTATRTDGWSVTWTGCDSGGASTDTCNLTLTGAENVTATFTLDTNTVTVTADGNGSGTVSSSPAGISNCSSTGGTCSASFNYGATVTLTAAPSAGSTVAWSGCSSSSDNTCTLTSVTSALNVTATFALDTNTVTVTADGNGSGTVSSSPAGISNCSSTGGTCSASFNYGATVTLTAAPSAGSTVAWSGCSSSSDNTCTLTNVTSALNVTATFTLQTHSLNVTVTGTGTVSSSPEGISSCSSAGGTCSAPFNHGQQVTLSASHELGVTVNWTAGCDSNPDADTCVVSSLTADTTVTVEF